MFSTYPTQSLLGRTYSIRTNFVGCKQFKQTFVLVMWKGLDPVSKLRLRAPRRARLRRMTAVFFPHQALFKGLVARRLSLRRLASVPGGRLTGRSAINMLLHCFFPRLIMETGCVILRDSTMQGRGICSSTRWSVGQNAFGGITTSLTDNITLLAALVIIQAKVRRSNARG
jgi:hypothetical protein